MLFRAEEMAQGSRLSPQGPGHSSLHAPPAASLGHKVGAKCFRVLLSRRQEAPCYIAQEHKAQVRGSAQPLRSQ